MSQVQLGCVENDVGIGLGQPRVAKQVPVLSPFITVENHVACRNTAE